MKYFSTMCCIVPSLGCIFVMHTSRYKMVFYLKDIEMKTLIKKLKLGVLLTGLVILTSCGSDVSITSAASVNAIYRTIPSLAVTATKYTGNKISKYLMNSSAAKNETGLSGKKVENPVRNRKVMPISIGMTGEARLVSSKPLSK